MSAIDRLKTVIYHEKQQEGSMLCAQHALNSLLQEPYFSAPDLSSIARDLDELEQSYDENNAGSSTNMDDTGFFSVQVLENALRVFGLKLVRWRGSDMRPYQDRPHTQLAFILNSHQHWYTLRRFGMATTRFEDDPGEGHWFNLNSFEPEPQWIGKLYLGMVLQQAESEGYSAFAIVQLDPNEPLALARTEADDVASTISDEEASASTGQIGRGRTHETGGEQIEGLEDEDYELQAVLQASLMAAGDLPRIPPASAFQYMPPAAPSNSTPGLVGPSGQDTPTGLADYEELDPVAASAARNKARLERMLAEQQGAHQELWEAGLGRPRPDDEDEDEMLRRAIAESEAMASAQHTQLQPEEWSDIPRHPDPSHHVYDDDDTELQAALRASLEDGPLEQTPPSGPEPRHPVVPQPQASRTQADISMEVDDDASVISEDVDPVQPAQAPVSMEDIRRARLARFGG